MVFATFVKDGRNLRETTGPLGCCRQLVLTICIPVSVNDERNSRIIAVTKSWRASYTLLKQPC